MKRAWIAFLALALAALIPGAALAAAGDAEIRADGEILTEYSDGLTGACALDGTLYLCGLNHIFSYDPTRTRWPIPWASSATASGCT